MKKFILSIAISIMVITFTPSHADTIPVSSTWIKIFNAGEGGYFRSIDAELLVVFSTNTPTVNLKYPKTLHARDSIEYASFPANCWVATKRDGHVFRNNYADAVATGN